MSYLSYYLSMKSIPPLYNYIMVSKEHGSSVMPVSELKFSDVRIILHYYRRKNIIKKDTYLVL